MDKNDKPASPVLRGFSANVQPEGSRKDAGKGNKSFCLSLHLLKRLVRPLSGSRSSEKLQHLQHRIGYQFKEIKLLETALTHRSYLQSAGEESIESNERLEFLGDAVLGLIVGEYLYQKFPRLREGELSQFKSYIVSGTTLAKKASQLGLDDYLFLSGSEVLSDAKGRVSVTADAFEALVGAIYLDGGLEAARRFLHAHLLSDPELSGLSQKRFNFKSRLLEYSQARGSGSPSYVLKTQEGPDHRKLFTVEVFIQKRCLGQGKGRSKKEAEQAAAEEALKKLGILKEN